jgi:hypothetical protein
VREIANDHAEAHRQAAARRADAAAVDVDEDVAAGFQNAESRDAESRVDSENAADADGGQLLDDRGRYASSMSADV